jgi:hypothetical protein
MSARHLTTHPGYDVNLEGAQKGVAVPIRFVRGLPYDACFYFAGRTESLELLKRLCHNAVMRLLTKTWGSVGTQDIDWLASKVGVDFSAQPMML